MGERKSYWSLWRGVNVFSDAPYPGFRTSLVSGVLGFGFITLIGYLHFQLGIRAFVVPFGASAVLAFGAPGAPFSQPRNIAGGHFISAVTGITVFGLTGSSAFWALGLSAGTAIFLMVLTKTTHPPAGATSLIPVLDRIESYAWAFQPVLLGALIAILFALVMNNLMTHWNADKRPYPVFWW